MTQGPIRSQYEDFMRHVDQTGVFKSDRIKVLGEGELKSALTIKAHKFSKSAQEKITSAGGKFEVLA